MQSVVCIAVVASAPAYFSARTDDFAPLFTGLGWSEGKSFQVFWPRVFRICRVPLRAMATAFWKCPQ